MNFYDVLLAKNTNAKGFVNHYESLFANALNGGGGDVVKGYWDTDIGINNNTNGKLTKYTTVVNNNRVVFCNDTGEHPLSPVSAGTIVKTVYPIAIPRGVKGIKAVVSSQDVYLGITELYTYNGSNWCYSQNNAWLNPNETHAILFNQASTHWVAFIKHGSAGTDAVTQSDIDSVTFEYTYDTDGWIELVRFNSSDLSQASLANSYNNGTYRTNSSTRVCVGEFLDITEYSGYNFKAEWTDTAADVVYYGINSYNEAADTQISNHGTISSYNTQSHGWYTAGTKFTMETTLDGKAVTTIRINFSCGSNHTASISTSQIDNVVIYVKPVS